MSWLLHTSLLWLRLLSLMSVPALGSAGLLITLHAQPLGYLAQAVLLLSLGVVPVIMFIGFTASAFSFPTAFPKALAVTLVTPALLLLCTQLLGWGAWYFFIDECFVELGGMGLGAALAAVAYGGGSLAVRLVGAALFGAAGASAMYLFGKPMLDTGELDLRWVGLNVLAVGWSLLTYFELFAAQALRRSSGDETVESGDGRMTRPHSLSTAWVVVLAITAWLGAVGVAVAWTWRH